MIEQTSKDTVLDQKKLGVIGIGKQTSHNRTYLGNKNCFARQNKNKNKKVKKFADVLH